jgi:hypothetical protein
MNLMSNVQVKLFLALSTVWKMRILDRVYDEIRWKLDTLE